MFGFWHKLYAFAKFSVRTGIFVEQNTTFAEENDLYRKRNRSGSGETGRIQAASCCRMAEGH